MGLYCTVSQYTVLYAITIHCTVLYHNTLYCTVSQYTVLYYITIHCTVLYHNTLYCTVCRIFILCNPGCERTECSVSTVTGPQDQAGGILQYPALLLGHILELMQILI